MTNAIIARASHQNATYALARLALAAREVRATMTREQYRAVRSDAAKRCRGLIWCDAAKSEMRTMLRTAR